MKGERCGIVSYWGPKSRRNVGSSVREAITGTNIEHQQLKRNSLSAAATGKGEV